MHSSSRQNLWFWAACTALMSLLVLALPSWATNLLPFPEELEKWQTLRGATVTPNIAVAPDGTLSADQINDNPNEVGARIYSTLTSTGGDYVFSVYLKAGTLSRSKVAIKRMEIGRGAMVTHRLTDEWQRYVLPITGTVAGHDIRVQIYPGRHEAEEGYVLAWGAQMEPGTVPTPYEPGGGIDPDVIAPATPSGLAGEESNGSVLLAWTANTEFDLAGYRVQRSADGVEFTDLASPATPDYTDLDVAVGATYRYRVAAADRSGNVSAYSSEVSVTVTPNPDPAPAIPTGLTAVLSGETVRLTWDPNTEPDLAGYRVERGVNSSTSFSPAAAPGQSAYEDTGVTAGNTYRYRVRAVDVAGAASAASGVVSVTIPLPPEPPSAPEDLSGRWTGAAVRLQWDDNSESDIREYQVERGSNSNTSFSQVASPTSSGYDDADVLPGNTYFYRVRAVDLSGAVSEPSEVVSVTVPLVSTAITRGPYLQMSSDTAITIRWRTREATSSRVLYGTLPGSLTSFTDELQVTTEHEVRLTNLAPETKYFYSVGSTSQILGGNDSRHFFVTHPRSGTVKPTRVWVIGDAGTANDDQRDVRDAFYRFTGTRQTDLWLMLGDNAYDDGTDSEYQRAVFNIYGDLLRQSVVWPTRGNHERSASTYYGMFTLPTRGEAGGLAAGTEAYYSFDYANIHFICLDSEGSDRSEDGDMAQWLRADLGSTTQTWVVVYFHHPPYSKGSHDSDRESQLVQMRRNIVPILEEGGVDLVLTGHSHSYERSFLLDGHYGTSDTLSPAMKLDPGDGREDGDGPYRKITPGPAPHQGAVYAVAGASGKTSSGSLDHPAMYISLKRLGSMVLDINGNRMDVKYLRETGAIDDYFTIVKGGG